MRTYKLLNNNNVLFRNIAGGPTQTLTSVSQGFVRRDAVVHGYQVYFQRLFTSERFRTILTLKFRLYATFAVHMSGHVLFIFVAPAAHIQAKKSS